MEIPAGEMSIFPTPGHPGMQPDVYVRWNKLQDPHQPVDVIVHLHGFIVDNPSDLLSVEVERSGLDFADPDGGSEAGRQQQSIGIIPRGTSTGGITYHFPALTTDSGGLAKLISLGLTSVAQEIGVASLQRGRLILTSHSGSGVDVNQLLVKSTLLPDEIHLFDATYSSTGHIADWAKKRLAADQAMIASAAVADHASLMAQKGGALRVIYKPGTGTEGNAQALGRALEQALGAKPATAPFLEPYYRVDQTAICHLQIPRTFGFRLLGDAASQLEDLPSALIICNALSKGMRGRLVAAWQAFLIRRGLLASAPSGAFDDATVAATRAFQTSQSLAPDGVVGPKTVRMAKRQGFDQPGDAIAAGAGPGAQAMLAMEAAPAAPAAAPPAPAAPVAAPPAPAAPPAAPGPSVAKFYMAKISLADILPINKNLTSARERTMISLLGSPQMPLTTTCQNRRASPLVERLLVAEDITPVLHLQGLKPAIEDVKAVLGQAFAVHPDLKTVLSTEGMLCVRMRKPTDGSVSTHISNHAWGTAVDFKIVGFEAPPNTGNTVPRFIAILIPFFNAAGWYSGVAFRDSMHFEVSEERIRKWTSEHVVG